MEIWWRTLKCDRYDNLAKIVAKFKWILVDGYSIILNNGNDWSFFKMDFKFCWISSKEVTNLGTILYMKHED